MCELPQVPGRGHGAKSEEDQRICRAFADAGDGVVAGHWLRQSLADCPLRHGQRSYLEIRRVEARLCDRSRVRSGRRSQEDGGALRGDGPTCWRRIVSVDICEWALWILGDARRLRYPWALT